MQLIGASALMLIRDFCFAIRPADSSALACFCRYIGASALYAASRVLRDCVCKGYNSTQMEVQCENLAWLSRLAAAKMQLSQCVLANMYNLGIPVAKPTGYQ